MPSPFPGMDPYLEDAALWPDVHHEMISVTREMLNAQLRPKYHVRIEERVYISDEHDPGRRLIVPDLRVRDVPGQENELLSSAPADAAVGVEVAEPVVVTTLLDEEVRDAFLEVIDTDLRQVVTVIEILSPANKCPGSRGRQAYLQKRQDVLNSPSHLVEIDLLRDGEALPAREVLPSHHYIVHVSSASQRPRGTVWPILLQQRLPTIAIPLRDGDPDSPLDLRQVLDTVYERAAYDLQIDYRNDPNPPLTGDDAAWADALLLEKGLRGS